MHVCSLYLIIIIFNVQHMLSHIQALNIIALHGHQCPNNGHKIIQLVDISVDRIFVDTHTLTLTPIYRLIYHQFNTIFFGHVHNP